MQHDWSSLTALNVSVVGLERALIQYCSQPNEQPFDMKIVPIEAAPITEMPRCMLHVVCVHVNGGSCDSFCVSVAIGETTPGAMVQKGPAASRQEVYAGTPCSHTSHLHMYLLHVCVFLPPSLSLSSSLLHPPSSILIPLLLSPSPTHRTIVQYTRVCSARSSVPILRQTN